MLIENLKRIFKKPDKEKEERRRQEINEFGLEKKDLPAMILSAYLVILPIAAGILILFGVILLLMFT